MDEVNAKMTAVRKAAPGGAREAFEQWYADGPRSPWATKRKKDGSYVLLGTEQAWLAWEACAAVLERREEAQAEAAPAQPEQAEYEQFLPFTDDQGFTMMEPGPDGFSEWVCPDPSKYLMKCCDCGLVHEAQFRVAKYRPKPSGEYEVVNDEDTQAQFRMRRHAEGEE